MKLKYIHTIHHYLGTFFFGMFLIWFLSGFVMMYKSFPFLSQKDRIAGLEMIQHQEDSLPHPAKVFPKYTNESANALRINTILGKVVYHLKSSKSILNSRFASTGEQLRINIPLAIQIAKDFTGIDAGAEVEILNEVDQWIPRPKYAKHLPVYKVSFSDANSNYVHISSKTGEVISNTSLSDRVWAWLGAIPHWIYITNIRMQVTLWKQLCIWLSAFGFIMALTGIITGIVRFKKKPKANFKRFKNKWYNIHYYTGLAFGLFVCTWIFSGFMSMSPFNWSYDYKLLQKESKLWQGRENTLENITDYEWVNFKHAINSGTVKEGHFSSFSNRLFSDLYTAQDEQTVCLSNLNYRLTANQISEKIHQISTTDPEVTIETLKEYDNYYYDRHNLKKLPVFKAKTNSNIVYYVNPDNGKVLLRSDYTNRLERWLYHGLHSLDFRFLTNNRPLWDIVMIVLLLGGTAVSVTAVGLGIKFIRRKRRKYLKKRNNYSIQMNTTSSPKKAKTPL